MDHNTSSEFSEEYFENSREIELSTKDWVDPMDSTPSPNTMYQDMLEDRPSYIDDPESGNEQEGSGQPVWEVQNQNQNQNANDGGSDSEFEIPSNQLQLETGDFSQNVVKRILPETSQLNSSFVDDNEGFGILDYFVENKLNNISDVTPLSPISTANSAQRETLIETKSLDDMNEIEGNLHLSDYEDHITTMIGLEIDTGLGMPKNLSTSPIHKSNNLTETCLVKSTIFSEFLIMSHHDKSMNEGGNGDGGMGGYVSPLQFGGSRGSSTPIRSGNVPNEDLDTSMVSIGGLFDGDEAGPEKSRKRSGDKAGSSEKMTVIEENEEEANSSKNSGRSTYSVPGTGASASASGKRRSTTGSLNNTRAGETEEERHLRMQALASQLEAARTASATSNGSGGNGNLGSGNAGARKTPPPSPQERAQIKKNQMKRFYDFILGGSETDDRVILSLSAAGLNKTWLTKEGTHNFVCHILSGATKSEKTQTVLDGWKHFLGVVGENYLGGDDPQVFERKMKESGKNITFASWASDIFVHLLDAIISKRGGKPEKTFRTWCAVNYPRMRLQGAFGPEFLPPPGAQGSRQQERQQQQDSARRGKRARDGSSTNSAAGSRPPPPKVMVTASGGVIDRRTLPGPTGQPTVSAADGLDPMARLEREASLSQEERLAELGEIPPPPPPPLNYEQAMTMETKTNPHSFLLYFLDEAKPENKKKMSEKEFQEWMGYLEARMFRLELEKVEAGIETYEPLKILRGEFHQDHGVVVAKNKFTRDYLIEATPSIGPIAEDGSIPVPGIGGQKVKAWPLTDGNGEHPRPLEKPTVVLHFNVPPTIMELAKVPPRTIMEMALIKSGIDPTKQETKKAFEGASFHYVDPDDKNKIYFLANPDCVSELVSEGRDCPPGHLYVGLSFRPVYLRERKINKTTHMIYGFNALPPKVAVAKQQEERTRRARATSRAATEAAAASTATAEAANATTTPAASPTPGNSQQQQQQNSGGGGAHDTHGNEGE